MLFTVFFLYQKSAVSDNHVVIYLVNTLVLIIFILSVYKIKLGLYLFIFFIPLLNSFTTILGIRTVPIILLLFFPLCLGFIVNYVKNYFDESRSNIVFDLEVARPVIVFIIIFSISCAITIFRYSNFYPFITNRYYDLIVNINGVRSTGSIFWTIRFFFNYVIGFALLFIIFNVLNKIKDIVVALIVLISSTMISSAVGFYQYFYNPFFGSIRLWVASNRLNATFTDPNSLGAYTLLLFPIFICLIIFFKKWYIKLVTGILFIPVMANMFFSGSRSAFLGLSVSLFIFIVLGVWIGVRKFKIKAKNYPRSKKVAIVVPIILAGIFLIFLVSNFLYRVSSEVPVNENIRIVVDSPSSDEIISGKVKISGWALDKSSIKGTGIKSIKVYVDGLEGKGKLLGKAKYGTPRPDVAEYFEKDSFINSGYKLDLDTESLLKGTHTLYIYAYSSNDAYSYVTHKLNVSIANEGNHFIFSNILLKRISSTFKNAVKTLKGGSGVFQAISSGRHLLWSQAIDMFKDYPISGVGLGAYIIELPNYYAKSGITNAPVDYTGNYYLQILSELGLPGLILILFIFYLIIKKTYVYFRRRMPVGKLERDSWLLAGFFISFISMIAAQFFGPHTNFTEIQFTFWLIIGLILTYIRIKDNDEIYRKKDGRIDKTGSLKVLETAGKIKFDLAQKISLGAVIVIFAASFSISSFHNLSINVKQVLYGYENKYGFYEEEVTDGIKFRWTDIDASEVMGKKGSKITVPIRSADPIVHRIPVFVRIYVDNILVKVIILKDNAWRDVEIGIPDTDREKMILTISASRSFNPKKWGISDDSRNLGVAVGSIKFKD